METAPGTNLTGYGGRGRFVDGLAYGLRQLPERHELFTVAIKGSTASSYVDRKHVISLNCGRHSRAFFREAHAALKRLKPDFVIAQHPYALDGAIVRDFNHVCRVIGYKKRLKGIHHFVTNSHFGTEWYGHPEWPVIYQTCDPDELEFSDEKDDYLLFMSNLTRGFKEKGLEAACRHANTLKVKLLVAGPPGGKAAESRRRMEGLIGKYVEYIGPVFGGEKKKILSRARALLYPIEEWCKEMGNTTVTEAAFCGTPVITRPEGCMPEYVCDGVTGFLCRTDDEYVRAIDRVDEIDPHACLAWARKNFDHVKLAGQYADLGRQISAGEAPAVAPWSPERSREHFARFGAEQQLEKVERKYATFNVHGSIADFARRDVEVVADVGGGPHGGFLRLFKDGRRRFLVDLLADEFDLPEDVEPVACDFAEMPFGRDEVDLIFAAEALDHCRDEEHYRRSVRALIRVLAPGGLLFYQWLVRKRPTDGHPIHRTCGQVIKDFDELEPVWRFQRMKQCYVIFRK